MKGILNVAGEDSNHGKENDNMVCVSTNHGGADIKSIYSKLKQLTRKQKIIYGVIISLLVIYACCLPTQPFNQPTSTVLFDEHGELLAARISSDQQWRFAPIDSIPTKMETCLLTFEDKNFYHHIGISAKGIARAIKQNIHRGKIVSGGSTITMQVIRLMRHNPARTFTEKIKEMIIATRLELRYSKKEILGMYFSNAPFGNNVVGLSAASWRYYGKSAEHLSWAESATLAVLPNAPGLIYPGKNHDRLLNKRNRLLQNLLKLNHIDSTQYFLALSEPLPSKPLPLPQSNLHLLQRYIAQGNSGKTLRTSIKHNVQHMVANVIKAHIETLEQNSIHNAAVVITDLKTGKIITYIGNTLSENKSNSNDVDCANAPRSSGSILKPILYAKSLDEGLILPNTLLPDVPSYFGSFNPKNYNKTYDGAVPANECLTRSLNIPMVHLLNQYGVDKFQHDLKSVGFSNINRQANHYGLTLILGGAEVSLLQLNKVYSRMALTLLSDTIKNYSLFTPTRPSEKSGLHAASIYTTFNTMLEVNRPDEEGNWRLFESSQPIAWKTGTSFGNRDAWAVGITPNYVVSVWVGNASGEGRPSLTGVRAAAPILFDIFDKLPKASSWFHKPTIEYTRIPVCKRSGYRAGECCEEIDTISVPQTCLRSTACPYHHLVQVNMQKTFRVNANQISPQHIVSVPYFILPPIMQKYYMPKHPDYEMMPPYQQTNTTAKNDVQIMYPKPNSKIYLPKSMDGSIEKLVCEAVSTHSNELLYWHIDGQFVSETNSIHQQSLILEPGQHVLTVMDGNANSKSVAFQILGR